MTEDIEMSEAQKKDQKKPSVNVKLEWIFGIRHDITPNIFLLDKDTLVYPASNYIVLYNYTKNLGPLNLQHYIPGSNHSKGIVCLTASNLNKKYFPPVWLYLRTQGLCPFFYTVYMETRLVGVHIIKVY